MNVVGNQIILNLCFTVDQWKIRLDVILFKQYVNVDFSGYTVADYSLGSSFFLFFFDQTFIQFLSNNSG